MDATGVKRWQENLYLIVCSGCRAQEVGDSIKTREMYARELSTAVGINHINRM